MGEVDGESRASRRQFLRGVASASTTAGAAAAGSSGTTAAQETTQSGGGGVGGTTKTVEVGPSGNYVFTPGTDEPLVIAPGTTVKWVWKSDNHNVHVDTQPDGANWSGHETIENSGYTYTHTFDTVGKYHYWCQPHKALGMIADLEVKEGGAPTVSAGSSEPPIPDSAKVIGIATVSAMSAILGFAYFFLKYGGDYGDAAE